jgi:hypothetical protein
VLNAAGTRLFVCGNDSGDPRASVWGLNTSDGSVVWSDNQNLYAGALALAYVAATDRLYVCINRIYAGGWRNFYVFGGDGNYISRHNLGGGEDQFISIQIDGSGNLYLLLIPSGGSGPDVFSYASDLTTLRWSQTLVRNIGRPLYDCVLKAGELFVAGYYDANDKTVWVLAASTGAINNSYYAGGPPPACSPANAIDVDNDGNMFIGGMPMTVDPPGPTVWKMNRTGNVLASVALPDIYALRIKP